MSFKQEILQQIREAFPEDRPPPRPITGHRCDECDETDRLLGGRKWRDVAVNFPQYCHDVFPLLTPEAKRYYLPAYMTVEVLSPGHMQGISVAFSLEKGDLLPAEFDVAQRAAIRQWGRWFYRQDHTPPPFSLATTWGIR